MRGAFHQPLDALAETETVVGDIEQGLVGRGIRGNVGRRHVVDRIVREQLEPFRQPPLVEQLGLGEQEVLDIGTRDILHLCLLPHADAAKTCLFQFDQNARICNSSSPAASLPHHLATSDAVWP